MAAAVDGAKEVFAARFDPLYGFTDLHGDEAHKSFFGIDIEFAAEAAAHFRRNHEHTILGDAEHLGDKSSQQVRDLRRRVESQIFFRATIVGDNTARFHGGRDKALAGNTLL